MLGVNPYDQARLQGRLWTPDQMKGRGMTGWWDPSDLSTITCDGSGNVSKMTNKSGVTNDATQGSPAIAFSPIGWPPSRGPALSVGSSGALTITNSVVAPNGKLFSAVCVGQCDSNTPTGRCFFGHSSTGAPELRWNSSRQLELIRSSEALLITSSAAVASNSYHVVGCVTDTNYRSVQIDGVDTNTASDPFWVRGGDQLYSSSTNSPANFLGLGGEIIMFNVRLSVADRQRLEGYCAWKWDGGKAGTLVGQLPGSHPYKLSPPLIGDAALRVRQPRLFMISTSIIGTENNLEMQLSFRVRHRKG